MWVMRMLVGSVVLCVGLLGCVQEAQPEAALPEAEAVKPAEVQPEVAVKAAAGLPEAMVPKPHKRPVVDGSLDDAAWRYAAVLETKFIFGGEKLPKQKTRVKVLADKKALYVAFICFESHMGELVASKTTRDSQVWQDDVAEFFLSPGVAPSEGNYHVLVNPKGTVADERYTEFTAWNAKGLKAAVNRLEDRWVVELMLPWKDLAIKEPLPARWRANFNRTRPGKGNTAMEDQAWSPTLQSSSHVPERFGFLTIEAFKTE